MRTGYLLRFTQSPRSSAVKILTPQMDKRFQPTMLQVSLMVRCHRGQAGIRKQQPSVGETKEKQGHAAKGARSRKSTGETVAWFTKKLKTAMHLSPEIPLLDAVCRRNALICV